MVYKLLLFVSNSNLVKLKRIEFHSFKRFISATTNEYKERVYLRGYMILNSSWRKTHVEYISGIEVYFIQMQFTKWFCVALLRKWRYIGSLCPSVRLSVRSLRKIKVGYKFSNYTVYDNTDAMMSNSLCQCHICWNCILFVNLCVILCYFI